MKTTQLALAVSVMALNASYQVPEYKFNHVASEGTRFPTPGKRNKSAKRRKNK